LNSIGVGDTLDTELHVRVAEEVVVISWCVRFSVIVVTNSVLCVPIYAWWHQESEPVTEARTRAEQGDPSGQFNLGVMYATGQDMPEDFVEAVRLYRLAASQGHEGAQNNLGLMYASGRGVAQNFTEAVRLYRLASENGHSGAQNRLGLMYATGRNVPQDFTEAVRLYRLAADQGHHAAHHNLGRMYLTGRGVPQDDILAYICFDLAVSQATNEHARTIAGRSRDEVSQRLTLAQRFEAQTRSDQTYAVLQGKQ